VLYRYGYVAAFEKIQVSVGHICNMELTYTLMFLLVSGVLQAVDAVISHLKSMSRNVTTPEEIAQVSRQPMWLIFWQLFFSCSYDKFMLMDYCICVK